MSNIPGTKANPLNSQLLISSGVPSLDKLLGGGIPVGTITLIEEDEHGIFAKTLLKYFLAEGIACNQHTYTIDLDNDPVELLKNLPALSKEQANNPQPSKNEKTQEKNRENPETSEKMKIAFRYQNLPKSTNEMEIKPIFGHYYDLSETMPFETINKTNHKCFNDELTSKLNENALKQCDNLRKSILNQLNATIFNNQGDFNQKNILRICIHHLGSIMWDNLQDVTSFLYSLRVILRNHFCVAMISVPTHFSEKLKKLYTERFIKLSDIALQLKSFSGTDYEKNKALADFHGFLEVDKVAAINSLLSTHPGAGTYTFKLLRKKFTIEKLHLPAGIDLDPNEMKQGHAQRGNISGRGGCGSSSSQSTLDF